MRRTKYAAVGSNVNLAGRIESFTTGGQLLISEATRALISAPLQVVGEFKVEPKGASTSLQLFEVAGIGAPYDLTLPSRIQPLHVLDSPVPVLFTVLEEKFAGRTLHHGHLVAMSAIEAGLVTDLVLSSLSNLKIQVHADGSAVPGGEIYAKVVSIAVDEVGASRIRFTSVSPELKTWIQGKRCAPLAT